MRFNKWMGIGLLTLLVAAVLTNMQPEVVAEVLSQDQVATVTAEAEVANEEGFSTPSGIREYEDLEASAAQFGSVMFLPNVITNSEQDTVEASWVCSGVTKGEDTITIVGHGNWFRVVKASNKEVVYQPQSSPTFQMPPPGQYYGQVADYKNGPYTNPGCWFEIEEKPEVCEGLEQIKIDPVENGTYGPIKIRVTDWDEGEPKEFKWWVVQSGVKVYEVRVKGGTTYRVYEYESGAVGGNGLKAPYGKGISHIIICWKQEATPTPKPSATATKTPSPSPSVTPSPSPSATATNTPKPGEPEFPICEEGEFVYNFGPGNLIRPGNLQDEFSVNLPPGFGPTGRLEVWQGEGHLWDRGCKPGLDNDGGADGCDQEQKQEIALFFVNSVKVGEFVDHWPEEDNNWFYTFDVSNLVEGSNQLVVQHLNEGHPSKPESVFYKGSLCLPPKATATPTPTGTNTASPTPTETATEEPTPTGTATNTPPPTATSTVVATNTSVPTNTPTPTATLLVLETHTPTSTPEEEATSTATATPMNTSVATSTPIPTTTKPPTNEEPTKQPTDVPPNTPAPTSTPAPTATPLCDHEEQDCAGLFIPLTDNSKPPITIPGTPSSAWLVYADPEYVQIKVRDVVADWANGRFIFEFDRDDSRSYNLGLWGPLENSGTEEDPILKRHAFAVALERSNMAWILRFTHLCKQRDAGLKCTLTFHDQIGMTGYPDISVTELGSTEYGESNPSQITLNIFGGRPVARPWSEQNVGVERYVADGSLYVDAQVSDDEGENWKPGIGVLRGCVGVVAMRDDLPISNVRQSGRFLFLFYEGCQTGNGGFIGPLPQGEDRVSNPENFRVTSLFGDVSAANEGQPQVEILFEEINEDLPWEE